MIEKNVWHVLPNNDLKEHDEETKQYRVFKNGCFRTEIESDCPCKPRIKYRGGNTAVVVHASWDGREAMEEVNAILNPKD